MSPTEEQYDLLQSQLNKLIEEGYGETFYNVGVGDDGSGLTSNEFDASLGTLCSLATTQNADCILLQEKLKSETRTAQYLVRKKLEPKEFLEIK